MPPGFFDRSGAPNVHGIGFSVSDNAPDVDTLVRNMNRSSGDIEQWARLAGDDTVLGVPVEVIEFGPTWVNGEHQTSGAPAGCGFRARLDVRDEADHRRE